VPYRGGAFPPELSKVIGPAPTGPSFGWPRALWFANGPAFPQAYIRHYDCVSLCWSAFVPVDPQCGPRSAVLPLSWSHTFQETCRVFCRGSSFMETLVLGVFRDPRCVHSRSGECHHRACVPPMRVARTIITGPLVWRAMTAAAPPMPPDIGSVWVGRPPQLSCDRLSGSQPALTVPSI
jgi:hypothetical protein